MYSAWKFVTIWVKRFSPFMKDRNSVEYQILGFTKIVKSKNELHIKLEENTRMSESWRIWISGDARNIHSKNISCFFVKFTQNN